MTDTPGKEQLHSTASICCNHAQIVIVGFDVTNRNTLAKCDSWIKEVQDNCTAIVFAVGNKIDLVDKREVSTEEARAHFQAMTPPVPYFETSAKTGQNVTQVFETAIREWRGQLSSCIIA